jgi:hypothetical protein
LTISPNSILLNNITTSSNNKQLISNTHPPGLTISSPTINITTSLDYPSFSIIDNNSWSILQKYHFDVQQNIWLQNRDLFEERFSETFLHTEGIMCPNSSFWF